MNIESQTENDAQSTTIGMHEITDAAELDRILKGNGKEVGHGEEVENPKGKSTQLPGKANENTEEENSEGNEEQEEIKYPSILHMLNAQHELGLNLKDDEIPTPEEQGEALSEIILKMTEGVNNALSEYAHIDELLRDPEVKRVLELKAQKKSLRDIVTEFAGTPQGQSDDELVINDFKKRYPKATSEMITSMVEPLKKNGQFAAFVTGLREQSADEQRSAADAAETKRKSDEQEQTYKDQQELDNYLEFIGNQTHVYGVPLTEQMKTKIVELTTRRDDKGMTYLDRALQSNEGTVLAILGITYMQDLMKNGASLEGNRKNAKFVNKLFQRPDALQSGSVGTKQDEFDPSLANKF